MALAGDQTPATTHGGNIDYPPTAAIKALVEDQTPATTHGGKTITRFSAPSLQWRCALAEDVALLFLLRNVRCRRRCCEKIAFVY